MHTFHHHLLFSVHFSFSPVWRNSISNIVYLLTLSFLCLRLVGVLTPSLYKAPFCLFVCLFVCL